MKASILTVAVATALSAFANQAAASPFALSSYSAAFTYQDKLGATTMTSAFDGTSYWSTSGGDVSGTRLARYGAAGNLLTTYSPGLDFRSVFTDAAGNVHARQFNDNTIYNMTSPGVFAAGISLAGPLDGQSAVVYNSGFSGFVALDENLSAVRKWDLSGNSLGSTALIGFGSQFGENSFPQNRGLAVWGQYWLTYSAGNLSAWDSGGNRVGTTQLVGAGTSFDSN